jgi:flagella basal body P-ring formation protein FlgA
MRTIAILTICAAFAKAGCIQLDSGRILAGDLAAAVPLFQALDPATTLGFSPLPGAERVLSSRELRLLAQRAGLEIGAATIPDLCVERHVRPLSRDDVQNALVQGLDTPGAEIELIDFSNQRLPVGRVEFRLASLNKPPISAPLSPVIWRGRLIYDADHTASVWAQVRITVERTWFVAEGDISTGAPIRAEQIRAAHGREFPFPAAPFHSPEEIVGKIARRSIPGGKRFLASAIEEPVDVTQGQSVRVKVRDGGASLTLDAVAQSSGKKGDSVLVHNPTTGRSFRAVVQDKGQVVVQTVPGT